MRVISQNGKLDFPYENIVVEIMDNVIVAYTPMTSPLRMAQYKSQEKAEKAMQLLHEAYTGVPFIMKNVEVPVGFAEQLKNMRSGFITVLDREDNVNIEPMNIVFRFPSEDEI
mgnify:FL=1